MSVPGKLTVQADGRVTGPATLTYNDPWPCVNGDWGSGAMQGVVMHTMVGNLPGTITVFNEPGFDASAHFGISQTGEIHQFGPIGKGWIAWAQEAGNAAWYSIEHADDGNPDNPLTPAQINASAQLVECLSAFAGFPLQEANSVTERGYGVHYMGGVAWGGHTCPDEPPQHVRSRQRPAILTVAAQIRAGQGPSPSPSPAPAPAPQPLEAPGMIEFDVTVSRHPVLVPFGTPDVDLLGAAPEGQDAVIRWTWDGQGSAATEHTLSWGRADDTANTLTVPKGVKKALLEVLNPGDGSPVAVRFNPPPAS